MERREYNLVRMKTELDTASSSIRELLVYGVGLIETEEVADLLRMIERIEDDVHSAIDIEEE